MMIHVYSITQLVVVITHPQFHGRHVETSPFILLYFSGCLQFYVPDLSFLGKTLAYPSVREAAAFFIYGHDILSYSQISMEYIGSSLPI